MGWLVCVASLAFRELSASLVQVASVAPFATPVIPSAAKMESALLPEAAVTVIADALLVMLLADAVTLLVPAATPVALNVACPAESVVTDAGTVRSAVTLDANATT